jgi:hypothetical protein
VSVGTGALSAKGLTLSVETGRSVCLTFGVVGVVAVGGVASLLLSAIIFGSAGPRGMGGVISESVGLQFVEG